MQSPSHVGSDIAPATLSGTRARLATTVAIVALVHTALIATVMQVTERPAQPIAIESKVITAQLLSQEPARAPAAAPPVALQSAAQPAPRPVLKKKAEAQVAPAHAPPAPTVRPAPVPAAAPVARQAAVAAPPAAPAHEAANSQSSQPSEQGNPQAQVAATAAGRETLAISAPKSVPHVDCRIAKPDYPALSSRRGETGTTEVRFVVGPTGAIEHVEIAKSSGYPRLDDAALAAVQGSSCRPYVENGTPIRVTYTQPFGFALND